MSVLLPVGLVEFRTAIAQTAETFHGEAWAVARRHGQTVFVEEGAIYGIAARMACKAGSVAELAYQRLRSLLANGALVAFLRMETGTPQPIVDASWSAKGSDSLVDVLFGRTPFLTADGNVAAGLVLLATADLAAVLAGEHLPRKSVESVATRAPNLSATSGAKRGRRHKAGIDDFWVEVCRRVYEEGLPHTDADLTRRMAQWCQDNMGSEAYGEESIRRKLGPLMRLLRSN